MCSIVSFSLLIHFPPHAGSHSEDLEDAQEDLQCPTADRVGGDAEEHVPSEQEADQGAAGMAHRTQIHEARWREH